MTYLSPQTQSQVKRSKYLEDALMAMREQGQDIKGGWGELGAKLAAQLLLQRKSMKADTTRDQAMAADMKGAADAILGQFGQAPAPQAPQPAQPAQPEAPQSFGQRLGAALSNVREAPGRVVDSLRTVQAAPQGAVDAVRSAPANVAAAPKRGVERLTEALQNAFGGEARVTSTQRTPEHNRRVGGVANSYHLGPNAVDFVMPGRSKEEVEAALRQTGLPITEFLHEKPGQRGEHFHWASVGDPQQPPQQPLAQQQPVQYAPMGGTPPPPQAPPPSSVSAAGAPPGSASPAPGGNPLAPTPGELQMLRQMLSNPNTFQQGQAFAQQLQMRMNAPRKQEFVNFNGVPTAVDPFNPAAGGQPLQVPQGAQNRTMTAEQLGIPAPPGTTYTVDPFGKPTGIYAPPEGFGVQGGGLAPIQGGPRDPYAPQMPASGYINQRNGTQAPIQGGPADPNAPQKPAAGYVNTPQGQAPIPGSPADPANPTNRLQAMQGYRAELKTVLDQATQLRRNVEAIRAGYQQQNGPGDIAMVNGIQRLIDEGVVREGDVALQLKSQGIEGSIAGVRGYMTSSGMFDDPRIRQAILKTGEAIYSSVNNGYRERAQSYRPIVERSFGPGSFEDVLPSSVSEVLGWNAPQQQGPAQGQPQPAGPPPAGENPAAVEAAMVKRFGPDWREKAKRGPLR